MAFSNAIAVCEAWLGKKSAFVRTPKFNSSDASSGQLVSVVKSKRFSGLLIAEIGMMFYFFAGAMLAFYYDDFSMFPYHLMLAFGFGIIVRFSIKEWQFTLKPLQASTPTDYHVYKEVQAQ